MSSKWFATDMPKAEKVTLEVWNAATPAAQRKILLEVDTGGILGQVLDQIPMLNQEKGVTSKKNKLKEIRTNPKMQRQLLREMSLLTEDEPEPTCDTTDDTSDNENISTERDSLQKERDSLKEELELTLKKYDLLQKECDYWKNIAKTRVANVQET